MATRKPASSSFDLLPAIDLRGGRVVRLLRGDFDRETVYGDDPVEVAVRFADAGARWLHVVDLDGARDPAARQLEVVAAIVAGVGERASVEVAGGLRDESAVEGALRAGAVRAVVGTAVLADPGLARRLVASHGAERVAVALDVRDGLAIGHGWLPGSPGVPVGAGGGPPPPGGGGAVGGTAQANPGARGGWPAARGGGGARGVPGGAWAAAAKPASAWRRSKSRPSIATERWRARTWRCWAGSWPSDAERSSPRPGSRHPRTCGPFATSAASGRSSDERSTRGVFASPTPRPSSARQGWMSTDARDSD